MGFRSWLVGPRPASVVSAAQRREVALARAFVAEAEVALDRAAVTPGNDWDAEAAEAATLVALRQAVAHLAASYGEGETAPSLLVSELGAEGALVRVRRAVEVRTEETAPSMVRWVGLGFRAALVFLALAGVGWCVKEVRHQLRTDWAKTARWRASSHTERYAIGGVGFHPIEGQPNIFFQTQHEMSPSITFDLGTARTLHAVDVQNRLDDHPDWAVPLVVEVSGDNVRWTEVGRRVEIFYFWRARFGPVDARYVRLRADRPITLNLGRVEIR